MTDQKLQPAAPSSPQTIDANSKTKPRRRYKILVVIIVLFLLIIIIAIITGSNSDKTKSKVTSTQSATPNVAANTNSPASRQVTGHATTLGAGSFTGGKDVVAGLYDVTPGAGQYGNFMVDGTDSYNEVLGGGAHIGVPELRAKISSGDQIKISGMSAVTFTPVTAPFISSHTPITLYSGTFQVNQDVGAGRYTVTPGSGQSGNFMVDGNDSYNEILGNTDIGGVPSLTVNLKQGDVITISSLSEVNFAPSQ